MHGEHSLTDLLVSHSRCARASFQGILSYATPTIAERAFVVFKILGEATWSECEWIKLWLATESSSAFIFRSLMEMVNREYPGDLAYPVALLFAILRCFGTFTPVRESLRRTIYRSFSTVSPHGLHRLQPLTPIIRPGYPSAYLGGII
jgi:hypothetical protein